MPLLTSSWALQLGLLALAGLLVCAAGGALAYYQFVPQDHAPTAPDKNLVAPVAQPDTVAAARPTSTTPPQPIQDLLGVGSVTYNATEAYAFPVAADPALYTWTYFHWDNTNAVDIEVRFGLSYLDFLAATSAPLVAVTDGIATHYSGKVGGRGYMLRGDDGYDYYYGHMSELWVPDGARVSVGQPLGRIGNTGNSARFIEPHLHFAIGPRDTLWDQQPSVNGAEWLRQTFDLPWRNYTPPTVAYDTPQGRPVQHPELHIVTPFEQSNGLPQPAIEFGFDGTRPDIDLQVLATIDGEVNVIRWTATYGTRLQITNRASDTAVVISGLNNWLVTDGDVVSQGQVIGHWNPTNLAHLHYMIFQNGAIIDPTPTLDEPER